MKTKKIVGILTVIIVIAAFTQVKYTSDEELVQNTTGYDKQPIVYSEEFPNAYIIVEVIQNNEQQKADDVVYLDSVVATVFIEDTYRLNVPFGSRLLSKSEVDKIGIENFEEYNNNSRGPNNKGKLIITFTGDYRLVGNGIEAALNGEVEWSGDGVRGSRIDWINVDCLEVNWSGVHTATSSIDGVYSNGDKLILYQSDGIPNESRTWTIEKESNNSYMTNANLAINLTKNTLEGGGDTSDAVLKYTHIYQNAPINILIGNGKFDCNFGVSDSQWSVNCRLMGIPY